MAAAQVGTHKWKPWKAHENEYHLGTKINKEYKEAAIKIIKKKGITYFKELLDRTINEVIEDEFEIEEIKVNFDARVKKETYDKVIEYTKKANATKSSICREAIERLVIDEDALL